MEDETERQGGFDGEIGILELPAPPADASRCPRGDRVRREPEGDVASPHEGSVVLGPVPDAIRCLVLRMHARLHIEIMTRRRSRWSTCRPLLAYRAESAHQRPEYPSPEALGLCGQAPALGVGEPETARTELLSEDAILFLERVNDVTRLLVDPARDGHDEELQHVGNRRQTGRA